MASFPLEQSTNELVFCSEGISSAHSCRLPKYGKSDEFANQAKRNWICPEVDLVTNVAETSQLFEPGKIRLMTSIAPSKDPRYYKSEKDFTNEELIKTNFPISSEGLGRARIKHDVNLPIFYKCIRPVSMSNESIDKQTPVAPTNILIIVFDLLAGHLQLDSVSCYMHCVLPYQRQCGKCPHLL